MLAQDAVTNAAGEVAGTAGDAGGMLLAAKDWLFTNGPGFAVAFVQFILILIIGFWIAKKLSAFAKKMALKSPNIDETLANFLYALPPLQAR